jgi:glycerol uptake facilitator protein
MSPFISEFVGTCLLILLGNGVVANTVLNKTYGHGGGWIVITFGWAMAVFVGVFVSASASGAHLNPAVSVALAILEKFSWYDLPYYVLAQITGAMFGQILVWLMYRDHYDQTEDTEAVKATFCTGPAISNTANNFIAEFIGTLVLVMGVLFIVSPTTSLGSLDALPVALLVFAIGLSLGGSTGYAINPARDFGPRIIHAILPLKYKGASGWSYSWIPVIAPLAGATIAAVIFKYLM